VLSRVTRSRHLPRLWAQMENDNMKRLIASSLIVPFALGLAACDVDQTEEAELPDVQVEGGNMPEFDVETADVDVGTEEKVIEVPDVDVTMPDADGTPVTGDE